MESQSLFNLAIEHINRSRYGKAIPLLKEAVHISPENPQYLSYLGLCLAAEEIDFDAALKFCRRALVLAPSDTVIQVNLGKVYKLMGDTESAYRVFLDAWRRNKAHPAPAAELSRMGIRRKPVIPFLERGHPLNKYLGMIRALCLRLLRKRA
jgi:Flp pilus assembly protein TadD